jgi:phage gpG-like protein
MSNHQQVTIVRNTAESNNETDALAQAIAEANGTAPKQEAPAAERPAWLPEKFKSPEDLAQAYSELERKSSSTKPSGFDGLEQYSTEFYQNGDLSEESIQAITTNMGIPEQIVRAYVDGQKAVMESQFSSVMGLVGGEEQYAAMTDWAAEALPEDEIDAFNKIMDGGDMNTIKMAVQGLQARYAQTNGTQQTGRLIQGDTNGPSGGAFRSVAEIVQAMKDPRYAKDPAYRRDVEQRVALSNALGVR